MDDKPARPRRRRAAANPGVETTGSQPGSPPDRQDPGTAPRKRAGKPGRKPGRKPGQRIEQRKLSPVEKQLAKRAAAWQALTPDQRMLRIGHSLDQLAAYARANAQPVTAFVPAADA